jgi:hypothetical protein
MDEDAGGTWMYQGGEKNNPKSLKNLTFSVTE